jgi:hypothetical protein
MKDKRQALKNKQTKKNNDKQKKIKNYILSCLWFVGTDCGDALECRYRAIERRRVQM